MVPMFLIGINIGKNNHVASKLNDSEKAVFFHNTSVVEMPCIQSLPILSLLKLVCKQPDTTGFLSIYSSLERGPSAFHYNPIQMSGVREKKSTGVKTISSTPSLSPI